MSRVRPLAEPLPRPLAYEDADRELTTGSQGQASVAESSEMIRSDSRADLRIRRASPADAETVHQLVSELAAMEGKSGYVGATPATWRDVLGRDDVVCFLAQIDGQVSGYASTMRRLNLWRGGDVLALDDIYVREGARSRGTGRQLMLAVAQLASRDGLPVVWGIESDNTDAQRFYRSLGAALRPKVLASWEPSRYRAELRSEASH